MSTPVQPFNKLCQYCLLGSDDGLKIRVCSGCRETHYCSELCQQAHWKLHKKACSLTTTAKAKRQNMYGVKGKNIDQSMKNWLRTNADELEEVVFREFSLDKTADMPQHRQDLLFILLDSDIIGENAPTFSIMGAETLSIAEARLGGRVMDAVLNAVVAQRDWHRKEGRELLLVFFVSIVFEVVRCRPFILKA